MADTLTTDAGRNMPGRCLAEPSTFVQATVSSSGAGRGRGNMLWSMMMWPDVVSRSASEPNPKLLLMPLAEV